MRDGLWFKRKEYGWGWTPANAAGWSVMSLYVVGCVAYPLFATQGGEAFSFPLFLGIIVSLTGTLIGVCLAKGEKPGWRWGTEK